nr:hypothetical protein [Tanacetum cinerariifolium]
MFIQPHDFDFVPDPIYPEYIPLDDKHVLPAKEQSLPPVVSPTAESTETEHVIPPPSTETTATRARITVRLQAAISLPPEAEIERLLSMPTPPPSPLASLSPPSIGEHLARCTAPAACPSPPPAPSPLLPSSGCPTQIQALRLSFTQALIDAVTTALPSPPLHMPPPVDRRDDIPETEMPPRKRLYLSTLGSREVGYGIRDTWVDPTETFPEIAPMTVGERVDLLTKDRIAHQETIQIVEEEAYTAREAWVTR